MITLRNDVDEYIFTKTIDNESLNMKFVDAIEKRSSIKKLGGWSAKTDVVDLSAGELFDEMSVIVEEFAIEASHNYNNQFEGHRLRKDNPYYVEGNISGTKCYVMWGMGYRSGEYTVAHNHWPVTWTFTYYIDPPEGCSGLYFPTLNYELKVEHGLLVLIKGDLIHEVKPSEFEGRRYCIGGLISANPRKVH